MANAQVVPNKTELRAYLSQGLTQQQIVDAWKADSGAVVSRSAIAMAIERYGLKSANPRPRYADLIPWRVANEHRAHLDVRMLRLEARRRAGVRLSAAEQRHLNKWLGDLNEQGAVVHYDRDTEQGFWWIERTKEHGDDIINRPKTAVGGSARMKMNKKKD